ncbi:hypothetical protein M408DRAFT_326261 [Serendipita vermifera MAFF 305830]|uniref:PA domain-containing protein n=1 Tax=Serendipita vermifera MAFF 305830 TaxID=933852 RepID=A0A0C3BN89_SERVB|nr:hypothetical protein M408DRAFT_326261 [Serendipita vermifera MAFF 305830]
MIITSPDKSQDPPTPVQPLPTEVVLPGPPPSAPKPSKKIRRRPIRIAAYAFILLSLAFVVHWRHDRGRPHPRPPKVSFLSSHPPFPPPEKQSRFAPSRLPHVEKTFMSVPNNDSALAASRRFASKPHLAGSEQDLATARMFLDLFQTELGIAKPEDEPFFDAGSRQSQRAIRGTTTFPRRITRPVAWIDTYYPVLNTGVEQKLEILNEEDGSVEWEATLAEDGDEADPDASKYKTSIPTWHGLSKGGDVTGPLVYVKYGRKTDFDELVASGVDLTGTIALVRYGFVFRGLKVKAAQEAGCVGILMYNDPHDDGTVTEELGYAHWPHGPARNPTSVQRGSVQFISSYPGDPTTPGYPAYKNATRVEATSRPSIPSLPISRNNGLKLLELIGDNVKSSKSVRLVNKVDDRVIPIYNTMAVIPGIVAEQAVIVGNHRDGMLRRVASPFVLAVCLRVNKLATETSIEVDTSRLHSALHVLLQTSLNLDAVRAEVTRDLEKDAKHQEKLYKVQAFKEWVSCKLGLNRPGGRRDGKHHWLDPETRHQLEAYLLAPEHVPAMAIDQSPMDITDPHPHGGHDDAPHSMMRVREISIRLARFERGFLSESGIKDREWYRHLGVAPGKWKGYGATPFPALSEAIQLDRNATLAKAEVGRLVEVVEALISTLTLTL